MFIAKQNSDKKGFNTSKPSNILSEIADKVLKIKSGIEAKIYSELYVGENAKLGNEDASKFIEMITNNFLSGKNIINPTTKIENLDNMYLDIEYKYTDNSEAFHGKKIGEGAKGSSCCNVFMMNKARYDNPFLNMNQYHIELLLKLTNINFLDVLNITDEKIKSCWSVE